jgi:HSP20 family protein
MEDGWDTILRHLTGGSETGDYPPVIVYMNDNCAKLVMKLPGVKLEDLDVRVNRDTVTLKGSRKAEALPEGAEYLRRERGLGSFARSFGLPFMIDGDAVEASYTAGILTVTLPKARIEQPRKVTIQSGN